MDELEKFVSNRLVPLSNETYNAAHDKFKRLLNVHDLAKKRALLEGIGVDNPLEPTPDAVGKADPAKWREWSIVENNEKAKLRTVVERVYPEGGEK